VTTKAFRGRLKRAQRRPSLQTAVFAKASGLSTTLVREFESLSAQLGQTLFYSLRLGLELGQIGFELGDLLGLAAKSSLELLVSVLSAMATRTTTTPASVFATTATPATTATASRVANTVMVAMMLMAAMVFVMMPVMMFVVFVSLVGRHEQPLFRPDR
jgi:hypothetical protein